MVSSLVNGCSAYVNGTIRVGDEMIEADGVAGLDFKQAREIILGRQGTTVTLTFRRQTQTYRVTLLRGNSDFVQVYVYVFMYLCGWVWLAQNCHTHTYAQPLHTHNIKLLAQLERKHQALLKENDNLRSQLRRQNEESELQRKQIEDSKDNVIQSLSFSL